MARAWLLPWSLGAVAFGGASLLVPLYVVELGGDAFDLGVMAAVAAVVGIPGAVAIGRRIDRLGHFRRYVLAVLAVTTAVLVVIPFIESIPLVIAANAILWLAFAMATPVLTMLVVSDVSPHAWSGRIARLNEYQGIGWALGLALGTGWTIVGGLLLDPTVALQTCFGAMAIVAALGLVTGSRWIPGAPEEADRRVGIRLQTALRLADSFNVRSVTYPLTVARVDFAGLSRRHLTSRFTGDLLLYFVAILLMFTGFAAFFAPLPAFLTDIGLGSGTVFALYLVSSAVAAVSFASVGRLAEQFDVTLLQSAGLALRGLAIPAVALAGIALGSDLIGITMLVGLFALIGASWAVITVTAATIVTALAPIAIRGESLGIYAALMALAGGIGSITGGAIANRNFLLAFSIAGGLVLLGAAIVYGLRRESVVETPTPASTGEDATGPT